MKPTYRFWGLQKPPANRPALVASLEEAGSAEQGVAVIRLYDPIDSWGGDWGVSAKEFATVLDGLGADVGEIRLHLNSPGGEVFEGIAIMNLLREHRASVTAVVDGLAASAASFLAASADVTVMGQNAELMIHDAWGLGIGNAADMRDLADRLDHLSDNIASVYAAKAGGTVADWRARMLDETWFSAEESVEVGLADRLGKAAGDQAKDRFDLSQFRHQGRADAPTPTLATETVEDSEATASAARALDVRHRHNARRHAA